MIFLLFFAKIQLWYHHLIRLIRGWQEIAKGFISSSSLVCLTVQESQITHNYSTKFQE